MHAHAAEFLFDSRRYDVRGVFLSKLAARLQGLPASRAKLLSNLIHLVPWDGAKAWRGFFAVQHLADVIGMSPQTVRRSLRDLEDLELLRILRTDRSASLILIRTDAIFEGGCSDEAHWWLPRAYRKKVAAWAEVGLEELTEELLVEYLQRERVPDLELVDQADAPGSDATHYQSGSPGLEKDHTHTCARAHAREAHPEALPTTTERPFGPDGPPPASLGAPGGAQGGPSGPVLEANRPKSGSPLSRQRNARRQAVDVLAAARATIAAAGLAEPASLELQVWRWCRNVAERPFSDDERRHLVEHAIRRACETAVRRRRAEPDFALAEFVVANPRSDDLGRVAFEVRQAKRREKRERNRARWVEARRQVAEQRLAIGRRRELSPAEQAELEGRQTRAYHLEVAAWAGVDFDQVDDELVERFEAWVEAGITGQASGAEELLEQEPTEQEPAEELLEQEPTPSDLADADQVQAMFAEMLADLSRHRR